MKQLIQKWAEYEAVEIVAGLHFFLIRGKMYCLYRCYGIPVIVRVKA